MMITGKSVFKGVAIGQLSIYKKAHDEIEQKEIQDTVSEVKR